MFVKMHDRLVRGALRGVPRDIRFILLELSMKAREQAGNGLGPGTLRLAAMRTDLDAVHDLLGGSRREIAKALAVLTKPLDPEEPPELTVSGPRERRLLTITSFSEDQTFDLSTARTAKHRKAKAEQVQQDGSGGNAFQNGTGTGAERTGNTPGTRLEKEGEREKDQDPEHPPTPLEGGASGEGPVEAEPKTQRSGPGGAEDTEPLVVRAVLAELRRNGEATASLATVRFARQLAAYSNADGYTGALTQEALLTRVQRGAAGVAAAVNTGAAMANPGGYMLSKVHESGGTPTRVSTTEGAERFRTFFAKLWKKHRKADYAAAANDAELAARIWEQARENARRTAEEANGRWSPDEEEILRWWVARHFERETRFVADGNWSMTTFLHGIGGFGLPQQPRDPVASSQGSTAATGTNGAPKAPRAEEPKGAPPPKDFGIGLGGKLGTDIIPRGAAS